MTSSTVGKDDGALRAHKGQSDVTEGSVLSQLAKRCEKATGPDRELDVAIVYALHPDIGAYQPHCSGEEPIFWSEPYRKKPAPRFTGSFDAAKKLVPDDHDYILEHVNGGLTIGARVGHNNPDRTSWGETDELALCAASLRAHAALLASKGENNV